MNLRSNPSVKSLRASPPSAILDVDDNELFWTLYNSKAQVHHKDLFESTTNGLDSLLTFAGLFSAVVTTLIAITLSLITSTPGDEAPRASREDTIVNALFVASLSCSVIAAFGAMAGKQVISHAFGSHNKGSPKKSAFAHQRALDAGMRWRFKDVLEALPVLLQLAILLFFAGLTLYLWNRSRTIAVVTLAFGCAGTVGYIILFQFATASFNPTGPWLIKGLRSVIHLAALLFGEEDLDLDEMGLHNVILLAFFFGLVLAVVVPVGIAEVAAALALVVAGGVFILVLSVPLALISSIIECFSSRRSRSAESAPGPDEDEVAESPDARVTKAERTRLKEARREFRCVKWALVEAPDDDIALEAARLIPCVLELDHIRELSHHHLALNHLLAHFLESIISEPSRPRDALAVYSTAVSHILLSLPPNRLNHRALTSLFREIHRNGLNVLSERLSLFSEILAIGYSLDETDSCRFTPATPSKLTLDPSLMETGTESYRSNLPFVYLSLSFSDEASDEKTAIDFVTQCARRLPPRQAAFLRIWFLSDGHKEHIKDADSEALKRRWRAYTSSLSISDELRTLLGLCGPETSRLPSGRRWDLLMEMLDDMVQLEVGDLGSGKDVQILLTKLNDVVEGELVEEEIFKKRPVLLVRLASHDRVSSDTREKSLVATQPYLESWIASTQTPVQDWGPQLADGLVKCFKFSRKRMSFWRRLQVLNTYLPKYNDRRVHPEDNEKLVTFLYDIAKEAAKKEDLAIVLLDAFRREMETTEYYPRPEHLRQGVVATMSRTVARLDGRLRISILSRYRPLVAYLAIWGGMYGSNNLRMNDADTPVVSALREWTTEAFIRAVLALLLDLTITPTTRLPELPIPVQQGLESFADFLEVEVSRGHRTEEEVSDFRRAYTRFKDGEGELQDSESVGHSHGEGDSDSRKSGTEKTAKVRQEEV